MDRTQPKPVTPPPPIDREAEFRAQFEGLTKEELVELALEKNSNNHAVSRENARRRDEQKKAAAELADREAKIKAAEEAKLLDEKKYQELIDKQKTEIAAATDRLSELEELRAYKKTVTDRQAEEVKKELATLAAPDRALFEEFATGLPEDSADRQLAFVRKLRERTGAPAAAPAPAQGGRPSTGAGPAGAMSAEDIYALKKTNPELYRAKLIELQSTPTWPGMVAKTA